MAKVFLHIGLPKTGTSAIQSWLHNHTPKLEEVGVLYPTAGRALGGESIAASHYQLAWSIVPRYRGLLDRTRSSDWVFLREELEEKQPACTVISSEYFWPIDQAGLTRLVATLQSYDVFIVIYLRNFLCMLLSMYKQKVKSGKSSNSVARMLEENLWRFDLDPVLKSWKDAFGPEKVIVKTYDKVQANLIEDFTAMLGVNPTWSLQSQENISPSDGTIRAIRLISQLKEYGLLNDRQAAKLRRRLSNSRQGNLLPTTLESFFGWSLISDSDRDLLSRGTFLMQEKLLSNHVPTDEHHFFEFR